MMPTRASLRAMCRELLKDESAWPDATLNAWINDAIRDYSASFFREAEASLDCVAGQREYSLGAYAGLQSVLSVEYPQGEDPPRFLVRRSETGAFTALPVYDVRGNPAHTLVLGEAPLAGETIGLRYSALHAVPAVDSTVLTIPAGHLEALRIFVTWQAVKRLEMDQAAAPDTTSFLLDMLGLNATRAERIYRARLEEYRRQAAPGAYAGPWLADKHDRIY